MDPPIEKSTPVVEPVPPRFTVAGALGVNASVPGPVRLNPGELTVTVALLVPTRWYLATCGEPLQVRLVPPPQVRAPAWLMLTTSPAQAPAPRTMTPKSRFCTLEMVSGL